MSLKQGGKRRYFCLITKRVVRVHRESDIVASTRDASSLARPSCSFEGYQSIDLSVACSLMRPFVPSTDLQRGKLLQKLGPSAPCEFVNSKAEQLLYVLKGMFARIGNAVDANVRFDHPREGNEGGPSLVALCDIVRGGEIIVLPAGTVKLPPPRAGDRKSTRTVATVAASETVAAPLSGEKRKRDHSRSGCASAPDLRGASVAASSASKRAVPESPPSTSAKTRFTKPEVSSAVHIASRARRSAGADGAAKSIASHMATLLTQPPTLDPVAAHIEKHFCQKPLLQHISTHDVVLAGIYVGRGAVLVEVNELQQQTLGFHPQGGDSSLYPASVKHCMNLGVANNNGDYHEPPALAVSPSACADRLVCVPQRSSIFDFVTKQFNAVMSSAVGGLYADLLQVAMPVGMSRMVYTKDVSIAALAAAETSAHPFQHGFFPFRDAALKRFLEIHSSPSAAATAHADPFLEHRRLKREHFMHARTRPDSVRHALYQAEAVLLRRRLDNLSFVEFDGVTHGVYVYIKDGVQIFNVHIEQMLFPFVHHQLEGESLWVIVPFSQLPKLFQLGAELYAKLYKPSGTSHGELLTLGRAFVLSKQLFLSPAILRDRGIDFVEQYLHAGEVLSAHGGCAHFGFSTRSSATVSVASNSCTDLWLGDGLPYLLDHFNFLARLQTLWDSRNEANRRQALGSPPQTTVPGTQLKSTNDLVHKAINNCPPNYVCAFLRGLHADLVLLNSDLKELAVCEYPTLISRDEINKHLKIITDVLTQLHTRKMRAFLHAHASEGCRCPDCTGKLSSSASTAPCLSMVCRCEDGGEAVIKRSIETADVVTNLQAQVNAFDATPIVEPLSTALDEKWKCGYCKECPLSFDSEAERSVHERAARFKLQLANLPTSFTTSSAGVSTASASTSSIADKQRTQAVASEDHAMTGCLAAAEFDATITAAAAATTDDSIMTDASGTAGHSHAAGTPLQQMPDAVASSASQTVDAEMDTACSSAPSRALESSTDLRPPRKLRLATT